MKSALLRAYGGTAGTEDAVKLGLKWLAKQQRQDGSWSLLGPYASPGIAENKAAATGMAMLAFSELDNTHREGEYRDNVIEDSTICCRSKRTMVSLPTKLLIASRCTLKPSAPLPCVNFME